MMKRITGILLLLIGLPIIWLFPALTAPRESNGNHLPREKYLQTQLQEHKQRHTLNLRVCIPAGMIVGIGAMLLIQGFRENKKVETQHQRRR
jgi:hypothetical protein